MMTTLVIIGIVYLFGLVALWATIFIDELFTLLRGECSKFPWNRKKSQQAYLAASALWPVLLWLLVYNSPKFITVFDKLFNKLSKES